jgi:hypothetical protein
MDPQHWFSKPEKAGCYRGSVTILLTSGFVHKTSPLGLPMFRWRYVNIFSSEIRDAIRKAYCYSSLMVRRCETDGKFATEVR